MQLKEKNKYPIPEG